MREQANHQTGKQGSYKSIPRGSDITNERRRKGNGSGEDLLGGKSVGLKVMGIETHELLEDNKGILKKNIRNNIHLQPLDHNLHGRGSSVPPVNLNSTASVHHPVNFAPSPNQRGGINVRL
jgi:hypothetical protein